ncbi:hypothetical protein BH23ACI1_BH23ACI1_30090 [soil metagenome]
MTRTRLALIATALAVLVAGTTAFAHPNHKVMGTVTMAAADHVMIKTKDGKEHTVKVVKATKVTREKKAMKAQDIPVGARVVATTVSAEDMTAKTIEVGVVTTGGGQRE